MASVIKQTKEKPARILPRQTAASAARAARNAANRTQSTTPGQRQSPVRSPPSPATSKINRNCENEVDYPQIEVLKVEATVENAFHSGDAVQQLTDEKGGDDVKETPRSGTYDDGEENTSTLKNSRPATPKPLSRPSTPAHPLQNNLTPDSKSDNQQHGKSRPNTPQQNTCKFRASSRPNTPRCQINNLPITPKNYITSRPNTPQRHTTPTRAQTPSTPASTLQRPKTPVTGQAPQQSLAKYDNAELTYLYSTKQKEFRRLKKELDLKQQAILEVFDGLKTIRERMQRDGANVKDETQELVIFNIADWAAEEIQQLCRDALDSLPTDQIPEIFNEAVIDERTVAEVECKALKVPKCFAELCLQAFTARQELIDWIKDLFDKNEITNNEALEKIAEYNTQGLDLCDALRETKSQADRAMGAITTLSKKVCQEKSTLMSVGESLLREVTRLRRDLEMRANTVVEVQEILPHPETTKALEEVRRELEEERTTKTSLKDKLTATETQLRNARNRVTKMDKQLREAEASIASLTGTVKTLEDQSRQREVSLEARARKLKESIKTGEVASSQLVQQRTALQTEVYNLKEQLESTKNEYKSEIEELNLKLKSALASLEVEQHKNEKELEIRNELEEVLNKNEKNIEDLQAKITELENSRINPDLPTEREMDLWSELHATKDSLRLAEEEIITCKREKVRFLESLTKIAESEDKMGMQQKLAAELLSKEEVINKLQTQIREGTKNIKLNEQKVAQYEQYIHDIHAHSRASANYNEDPNGATYTDLQREVINLQMSLLEAAHRNEELSEKLCEKEQQLEQQDKTARAQARVIKVREELINMLKNKETEQSRELLALQQDLQHRMQVVEDINKEIGSKAGEIQDLFSSLENKQQQIQKLEHIVLSLEEQQRRSQAQRMRHEEKIASLEHELADGINRKERKFLFF